MTRPRDDAAFQWWPALLVVGAIAVVTLGGRIAAAVVDGAATATVGVFGVATIALPDGWTEAVDDALGEDPVRRFVVTKGAASAVLTAIEGAEAPAPPVATAYVRDVLEPRLADLVTTPPQPVVIGGVPGVRITYLGETRTRVAVEGVVAVAVASDGSALVLDAYAPEGFLATVAADVEAMWEGARLG